MDDTLGSILACAGMVFWVLFLLAFGVGWLIYKFCELVLPPLFDALYKGCDLAAQRLAAWWREVTWKHRVIRAHNQALRQMDATRRQSVAWTHALVDAIEGQQIPTADATTVVRVAVRSAVRPD